MSSGVSYYIQVLLLCVDKFTKKLVNWYKQFLQLKPVDTAKIHENLGTANLRKGAYDSAISHFQKVVEADPDNAQVHYSLGVAYQQADSIDNAIESFKRSIEASST